MESRDKIIFAMIAAMVLVVLGFGIRINELEGILEQYGKNNSAIPLKLEINWSELPVYYDSTYSNVTRGQMFSQACHNQIINSSGIYRSYKCSPFTGKVTK